MGNEVDSAVTTNGHKARPVTDHHSIEPVIDHHSIEPVIDHHSIEPVIDHHSIEPVIDHHSIESVIDHHSIEPVIDHHSIEPVIDHHSIEPVIDHLSIEPVIDHHSIEPVTAESYQEPENTNRSNSMGDSSNVKAEFKNAEHMTNNGDSIGVDKGKSQSESATVFLANKFDSFILTDQSKALDSLTASQNGLPLPDLNLAVQSDGQPQSSQPKESQTSLPSLSNSNISKETSKPEKSSSIQTIEGSLSDESVSLSVPNIRQSIPPLSDSNLSVPVLSPAYLRIDYLPGLQLVSFHWTRYRGCKGFCF